MMKRIALPVLVLLMAAGVTAAETRIDRTESFPSGGTLTVEMIAGELIIEGWSRDEVQVTGVLTHRCESFEMDRSEDSIDIEVDWECDGHMRNRESSRLTIRVPRKATLEVETVSVSVDLSGVDGRMEIETVSGTLDVRTDSRMIELASVSGKILLEANTPVRELELETVSGTIIADVDPDSGASVNAESISGSITLRFPSSVSARFDVSTFSGSIRSEFGTARRTSEYLPSSELSFSQGGGSADISVETLSGRITLETR